MDSHSVLGCGNCRYHLVVHESEERREVMSELGERVALELIRFGNSITPYNIPPSPKDYSDKILAAFKAHIEGCEKPENPNKTFVAGLWEEAIDEYRKALMESL